jgi:hypothetical protein
MRGGLGAREQREQDAFHLHAAVHESLSGTKPTGRSGRLCLVSGVERKLDFEAVRSVDDHPSQT